MTTLIVVRHGQSESNLSRVFTGQGNTPLTALGIEQAQRTAAFLSKYKIDKIYASDLNRAMDTAKPTAIDQGLEIIPTPELREIYAGDWEGNEYTALLERYPEEYGLWIRDIGRAHPKNGESVVCLADRIYRKLDQILKDESGKCVAIFTHATPARMIACRWFGYAVEDAAKVPFCSNASVSIAEYSEDGSCRIVCYGYDQHQGDDATGFPQNIV